MNIRYLFLLPFVLLGTTFNLCSQIVITPNVGAVNVANSVSSSGIVVSNVTINCGNNSYGTFSNGSSSGLGLTSGLLLTTGLVSEVNANGTNQNDDFDSQINAAQVTDAQLTGLIGTGINMYDKCIIEFDIIPQCGTISVTFSFGSDEYTNWVSAGWNDAFGFFVTGQNPAGGNYTNTNIAVLPSGTVVSIDNVNSTTNAPFFINNNNGAFSNHFDGFTTVLTPTINVVPCQTYHFKLAIADAGDANVDSGVLIDIIQCTNPLTLATTSTPDHCVTSVGTATVTTTGGVGPLTYSWAPTGGTNATATGLLAGTYTVTVADALSCSPDKTSTIVVGNSGITPTVVVPANITVCNGQTVASNNFTSPQAGTTFSWANSNIAIGLAAAGIGSQPSFSATNTGNSSITSTITVTPILANECPGTPLTYTITILPTPVMSPLTNLAICSGVAVPASVFTSTVLNTNYNWTNTTPAIGLSSGASGNTPLFTSVNLTSSILVGTITVIPNLNNTCYGVPVSYSITVNPTPVMSPIPNVSVCVGGSIPTSVFGSNPIGATYTWTNSNVTIGLIASGVGDYVGFTALNPTTSDLTATIDVIPTLNGCIGLPLTYTLNVIQKPVMNPVTPVITCVGTMIPLSDFESTTPIPVTYNWTNSNTIIGLNATGVGDIPPFMSTNTTSASIISTIDIIPSIGSCVGLPVSYTIEVKPIPTMVAPSSITVCPADLVSPSAFISNPVGSTFNWVNTNTSINLAAAGISDIVPFNSTNTTNLVQLATINVTPSLNGCIGNPVSFTVTVNPIPTIAASSSTSVCANTLVSVPNFISNPTGAIINWTNTDPTIGLGAVGVGNISSFNGINNTQTPVVGTIEITPTLNSCVGLPVNFSIIINPIPIVSATNNGPICEGETLELNVNSTANATYSWTQSTVYNSSLQNPTIINSIPNQSGVYTVSVTANNCTNTGTTTVLINPLLLADIVQIGPFCANDLPVNLSATFPTGTWSGFGIENIFYFNPSTANVGINTITFTTIGSCPTETTSDILVNEVPQISFISDDTSGCAPLTIQFTNTTNLPSDQVVWSFGDNTTSTDLGVVTHIFTTVGCFDITLESTTNGCSSSLTESQMICVYPNAIASFSVVETDITVDDPTIHLQNFSQFSNEYTWNFGDTVESNLIDPSHSYVNSPSNYTITLIAQNEFNCPDTAYLDIRIKDVLIYYVPNSFTPDGDDHNPTFKPVFTSGFDPNNYVLYIFNRWGEIVFESHDTNIGWDGTFGSKKVQDGVHTWKIEFKDSESNKTHVVVGHVSILR